MHKHASGTAQLQLVATTKLDNFTNLPKELKEFSPKGPRECMLASKVPRSFFYLLGALLASVAFSQTYFLVPAFQTK